MIGPSEALLFSHNVVLITMESPTANTSCCMPSYLPKRILPSSLCWLYPSLILSLYQVASLRQQLERLQGGGGERRAGGGGGVAGGCGPEASCGRSLAAMERAHRQALEELQRQHQRQTRELETEKDRLMQAESQATAQGQT